MRHAKQSDKGLNPWNIDFFVNYFGLDREQITGFQTAPYHFIIKSNHPYDAHLYYELITSKGIYPRSLKTLALYKKRDHSMFYETTIFNTRRKSHS